MRSFANAAPPFISRPILVTGFIAPPVSCSVNGAGAKDVNSNSSMAAPLAKLDPGVIRRMPVAETDGKLKAWRRLDEKTPASFWVWVSDPIVIQPASGVVASGLATVVY